MVLLCDAISLTQFAYRLTVHFSSPGKDPSQHLGQDGMGKEKKCPKRRKVAVKDKDDKQTLFFLVFIS